MLDAPFRLSSIVEMAGRAFQQPQVWAVENVEITLGNEMAFVK
jgi:hypothetical protein